MIPFFQYTEFMIGPLTIHVWGLMVALGILAGLWVMKRTAVKLGLKLEQFEEAAFWILLCAFIGARVGDFIFYQNLKDFLGVFRIWEGGWSSFGGLFGGALAAFVLIFKKKFACSPARACDVLLSGFPIGMAIGRIGCFLIHDHPGTLSHFMLAVKFPEGARHDLGLYESLAMFVLAAIMIWAAPKLLKKEGQLAYVTAIAYALIRFPLDFLRVGDMRYLGLTAAQYGCLLIIVIPWRTIIRRATISA